MRIKRSRPLLFAAALCLSLGCAESRARAGGAPDLASLRQVAQLPAELPRRVSSIAFDGEKLWVTVYLGGGRHAVLNPSTLGWEVSREAARHSAIGDVSGSFRSPGGICFAGERLWVGGSYGDSLGFVDTRDWKVGRAFTGKRLAEPGSQSYAALACDGSNVWVAWHRFSCTLPPRRRSSCSSSTRRRGRPSANTRSRPAPRTTGRTASRGTARGSGT